MPLNIVRSDITRLSADAIVNTANPEAAVGPGVDRAVFEAAGFDELLAERRKIGRLEPGQAAATPAFALDAKYVIHTVGPLWEGGSAGEEEAVASCYRNSLSLARELGCASAAFPLISTGTLGFPKDRALKIAVDEISSFLMELPPDEDMDVTLAVYDRESFALSGKLF
ncbi:MAG: macro domain-containing protein, partial [Firmicutes bacterium]|nr:macro domain-containing protein [Bacillota bacterium]